MSIKCQIRSNALTWTRHAAERSEERRITPEIVDLLHQFGSIIKLAGAYRFVFDDKAVERLQGQFGGRAMEMIRGWRTSFVVASHDGFVITVARNHARTSSTTSMSRTERRFRARAEHKKPMPEPRRVKDQTRRLIEAEIIQAF